MMTPAFDWDPDWKDTSQVPRNVYHTFVPHEDGMVIFEAKDRAYDPEGTEEFLRKE